MKAKFYLILSFMARFSILNAQKPTFRKINKATSIKDQSRAGTYRCFATVSYLELELLRTQDKKYDLSETFVVYYSYINKAIMYVRMRGNINFTQGGQAHDVLNVIKKHGIVP